MARRPPRSGSSSSDTVSWQIPNLAGRIRRSQVVTTYGPGAIVDFRSPVSGAPLSGVIAGLEEWDQAAPPGHVGLLHDQVVHEPRLEKRLHVDGFRLPPVRLQDRLMAQDTYDVLPVTRFPDWLQCPRCDRLKPSAFWMRAPGKPERWCGTCSEEPMKVFVVPVRFIVACEDGHLDEFPWKYWIGCSCERPDLRLDTTGPGLAGKRLRCGNRDCTSRPRSMEDAFQKNALSVMGVRCRGPEPWLPNGDASPCDKIPRVLQRGASNVYYGIVESSLDIPPFSEDLKDVFGSAWSDLKHASPSDWPTAVKIMRLEEKTGRPANVLLKILQEWNDALSGQDEDLPIEWPEYMQFKRSGEDRIKLGEFETKPEGPPPELSYYLADVVLATRLREVRALTGFTRILPSSGMFRGKQQRRGRLCRTMKDWLPAVVLRGEGIFLRFNEDTLREWEERTSVRLRTEEFNERLKRDLTGGEVFRPVSARFLLVHSFSHSLMRQLSLDCGYSSSALRERLYVGDEPYYMAGVLLHTGTPDSEGTLGGLVRQGLQDRFVVTVSSALSQDAWCSSDPVCITGAATLSSPRNGAACHACLLVPETSCQFFNVLLDRALLVGTEESPDLGYFRDLVDELL